MLVQIMAASHMEVASHMLGGAKCAAAIRVWVTVEPMECSTGFNSLRYGAMSSTLTSGVEYNVSPSVNECSDFGSAGFNFLMLKDLKALQ